MRSPSLSWYGAVGLALLLTLANRQTASAHALGAECKLNGGRVELEAYYDDDTPARDAKVTVRDAGKSIVAQGRTDKEGCWSFAKPVPGAYQVVVDAGAGHLAKLTMTIPASEATMTAAAAAKLTCDCCEENTGKDAEATSLLVSEGPPRNEFTRLPWGKVALGLGLLAGASWSHWYFRQRGQTKVKRPATS